MSPLVPCPSCARHVRAAESACPFCATSLPSDLAARAVPPAPRRLERLAAFTFAATVAATACGGKSETPGEESVDGGTSSSSSSSSSSSGSSGASSGSSGVAPPYGLPPEDGGGPAALYGAPAPDGGSSGGSSGSSGNPVPAYGAPPAP